MEISQLEVFLAVAREGGFSRAAEKLYRTQSAVSQAIRKLESEIGELLFDRSPRYHIVARSPACIRRSASWCNVLWAVTYPMMYAGITMNSAYSPTILRIPSWHRWWCIPMS